MLEKIKTFIKHPYINQLRDVRALGLVVFGIITLMVTWSGVKSIQTNYELQKQISRLQQENEVQSLVNTNLKLANQYFQTDQYLELASRREFGRGARGEKVLIVPKNVALAHTIDPEAGTKQNAKQPGQKPAYQRNFEAWIDFFLHRQNTD